MWVQKFELFNPWRTSLSPHRPTFVNATTFFFFLNHYSSSFHFFSSQSYFHFYLLFSPLPQLTTFKLAEGLKTRTEFEYWDFQNTQVILIVIIRQTLSNPFSLIQFCKSQYHKEKKKRKENVICSVAQCKISSKWKMTQALISWTIHIGCV